MDLLFLKIHGAFFALRILFRKIALGKKPGYPLQFLKNYLEVIFYGISAPIHWFCDIAVRFSEPIKSKQNPCAEPTVFLRFAQFDFL
jgi:hypothetical protein